MARGLEGERRPNHTVRKAVAAAGAGLALFVATPVVAYGVGYVEGYLRGSSTPPAAGQTDTRDYGTRFAECINRRSSPLPPNDGTPHSTAYPDPNAWNECQKETPR